MKDWGSRVAADADSGMSYLTSAAWIMPVAVFLVVYAPAVGHGFISDDFGWILESRVATFADAVALFGKSHGFYRPIVSLSFAINYAAFGNHPIGYGLTNLALCLLCAGLIALTFQALGLTRSAGAFGAAVWLLNFHGINMAILWISGRTELLLIAAAGGGALAMLRGRVGIAIACLALALLSKEEAVALPAILLAWLYVLATNRNRILNPSATALLIGGMAIDLALYAWLRRHAGAITAATAPPYYRFTFAAPALLRNAAEYADRACTFAAAVTLLAWGILRPGNPSPAPRSGRTACGVIWIIGGYAVTLFLPVRSSLYACLPSIGAALVAAEICATRWASASASRRRVALWCVVFLPVLGMPIYVARDRRWTRLAEFSTGALSDLTAATASAPSRSHLLVVDDPSLRVNVTSTFGSQITDAMTLETGRSFEIQIESPRTDAERAAMCQACQGCDQLRLCVAEGHIYQPRPQ
jgi:hypothetical protein